MPHIHLKAYTKPTFPIKEENVEFKFIATNILHDKEQLVATKVEDKEFFLLVQDEERKLLKSDKITRVSPNYYVKHALSSFTKACGFEVLSSNVNDAKLNEHLENDSALKSIQYFADQFPENKNVQIEVGFGSGRHLLHQAANNPDILFIGIEIHRPSIEQVLKQCSIQNLDNVLVLDYDARLFLEFVPSNIVSKIFVHFPVPWDKKPSRRVISKAFLSEALRALSVDGRLELRTDSENYYEYSFATYTSLNKLSMELHKNREIGISSKYEDRWKKMEKNIYDLTLINDTLSDEISTTFDFSFKKSSLSKKAMIELNSKTIRFERGFLHFERLYITDEGALLFRLSMGSFDRPEHLYVLVEDNTPQYYPKFPVHSKTNEKAHQKLVEVLCG